VKSSSSGRTARRLALLVTVLLTLGSLLATTRLRLSRDLTELFPRTAEADALARVTRIFGGGDVGLVLLRGEDPDDVERAAEDAARELRGSRAAFEVMTAPPAPRAIAPRDAWRWAGPLARDRLARALSEDGMRARLRETHALLLAPGAPELAEWLARDPLRLAAIPWEGNVEIAAGARAAPGASFVADGGKTRLVVIAPHGRAFEGGEAARFVAEAEAALDHARAAHARVRFDLTGGHVIATQTEALVRSDLQKSGAASLALASVVFVLVFRRPRALVAVLPPLAAGTLWTTALASLVYTSLSAIATAFAAVVVGVGVDTGVHVYGRLLEARRDGLSPRDAADVARRDTWRPTLGAAVAAGGAFACLAMSDVAGMAQLGVLCGVGEIATAIAILVVVPEIGAMLERGPPPAPITWRWVSALTATRGRALAGVVVAAGVVLGAVTLGVPRIDHGVVALDARALPAMGTYDAIYAAFGGTRGQLMVVSTDPDEERARARADAVAEAAEMLAARGTISGFDGLSQVAPSRAAQAARLRARDALDVPGRAEILRRLLGEEGFAVDGFSEAIDALRGRDANDANDASAALGPAGAWAIRRHLGQDARGTVVVTYVRPTGRADDDAEARATLRAADPGAVLTSFRDLDGGLRDSLARDLPRVLVAASAIVLMALMTTLRSLRAVALASLVLLLEIALVLVVARVFGVRWHVYDALVLPILLGITLDEAMFLLEAAGRRPIGEREQVLASQAPLGAATALTTAAGFAALVTCRFDGLRDMGVVGALGSTVGLVSAFLVIPAGLRLAHRL
jgi:predicted RND superfamily exporter protein